MAPPCGSDFAQTTNTSAKGELLIQVYVPLRTKPLGLLRASVRMELGSDQVSGSVNPKQPIFRPATRSGRNRRFCISDPNAYMGCITRLDWTEAMER